MNSIDFCFWLQGYFEISGSNELTPAQVGFIKNHLSLVFKHEIDPLREKESEIAPSLLNELHNGNDPLIRC